jgi:hypothetical protein
MIFKHSFYLTHLPGLGIILIGISAQLVVADDVEFFKNRFQPFVEKYCLECHDAEEIFPLGDEKMKLDQLSPPLERDLWRNAQSQILNRTMPPAESVQPNASERLLIESWLGSHLNKTALKMPVFVGHVPPRRLTRSEYLNTVESLVGIRVNCEHLLPYESGAGEGFDNNAESQNFSTDLFENYKLASELIADRCVPIPLLELTQKGTSASVLVFKGGNFKVQLNFKDRTKNVPTELSFNGRIFGTVTNAIPYLNLTLDRGEYEFSTPSSECESISIKQLDYTTPCDDNAEKKGIQSQLLAIGANDSEAKLRITISNVLEMVFRRPPTVNEKSRYCKLFKQFYSSQESIEKATSLFMKTILISPSFLFRIEDLSPNGVVRINDFELANRLSYFLWNGPPDARLIRLAKEKKLSEKSTLKAEVNRLIVDSRSKSFAENFVDQWLGTNGVGKGSSSLQLVQPKIGFKLFVCCSGVILGCFAIAYCSFFGNGLHKTLECFQVSSLIFGFGSLSAAPFFEHDQVDLTLEITSDLRAEPAMFFRNIIKNDASVMELINSNRSVLNLRLARYYGLDFRNKISDSKFHEVEFDNFERGGFLGMGAVLALRENAVLRGSWVLDNLLGVRLPPPPPDVSDLPKKTKIFTRQRDLLDQHRNREACMACHNVIDPIGFGLENFDKKGRWRSFENGSLLLGDGAFSSGEEFMGPKEMKEILVESRKQEILRNLTKKMLAYALGRNLQSGDDRLIEELVQRLLINDCSIRILIHGIITSDAFLYRTSEGNLSGGDEK